MFVAAFILTILIILLLFIVMNILHLIMTESTYIRGYDDYYDRNTTFYFLQVPKYLIVILPKLFKSPKFKNPDQVYIKDQPIHSNVRYLYVYCSYYSYKQKTYVYSIHQRTKHYKHYDNSNYDRHIDYARDILEKDLIIMITDKYRKDQISNILN